MTARVMGFAGSPRKGMNSDSLVSSALDGARSAGADVEKIYLNDLSIRPCQACGEFPEHRYCWFEDGMDVIYRALEEADAIVVGTPAYFGGVSAQLKLMIDRCNCLARMTAGPDGGVTFKTRMEKRKKALFFWVAHLSKDVSVAHAPVKLWCRFANIELVDTVVFAGSDGPDAVAAREEALRRAFEAGARLVM
ncbi:MAG: flavodoxin family protein [Ignavibacteriales bacterium]